MLPVPTHIVKPPYAETGKVTRWAESAVKSPEIIERMRVACSTAAEVLRLAGEFVRPGITTDEIDVYVTTYVSSAAHIQARSTIRVTQRVCAHQSTK